MAFANIDVYSFIAKYLYFIVLCQTPVIHKGLCVIAGVPIDEDTPFEEIFLARIPIEKIIETKSYGMSDGSDYEEK